jgi:hypothetical protein
MYQYAYIVGDAILAIVWLVLFFLRKDLRKQQLIVSTIVGLFGPLADWLYRDYWSPLSIFDFRLGTVDVRIESVFFSFFAAGIAAILYETVFHKKHLYGKPRDVLAIVIILITVVLTIIFNKLGLNSIWASSLALFISAFIMLVIARNLTKDAVWTGVLLPLIFFILYFIWLSIYPNGIQTFWLSRALTGIHVWKIPIEEIIWFASAGINVGVLYEFWRNVKKYPRKK